jgi:hypothetical protein
VKQLAGILAFKEHPILFLTHSCGTAPALHRIFPIKLLFTCAPLFYLVSDRNISESMFEKSNLPTVEGRGVAFGSHFLVI